MGILLGGLKRAHVVRMKKLLQKVCKFSTQEINNKSLVLLTKQDDVILKK